MINTVAKDAGLRLVSIVVFAQICKELVMTKCKPN